MSTGPPQKIPPSSTSGDVQRASKHNAQAQTSVSSTLPSFLSTAVEGNLKPSSPSLVACLSNQLFLKAGKRQVCLRCPSEAKPHKLTSPPGFDVILKFSVPFRNRRRKPKSWYQVQRVKPVSSPLRGKSLTQNLRPDVGSFLLGVSRQALPTKGQFLGRPLCGHQYSYHSSFKYLSSMASLYRAKETVSPAE